MKFNLSEWAVTHRALTLFMILAVLVGGAFSFRNLGQLEDPHFGIRVMNFTVAWPGASPKEIHDHVLNPMERKLQELPNIDYVNTFTRQGFGAISLVMKDFLNAQELEETWYQARKKMGDMRREFPEGVVGPFFDDEYGDVYAGLYAVRGPEVSLAELKTQCESIKRQLQTVKGINKVDIFGAQKEQVFVEFSSQKLGALGLTPQLLMEALKQQNNLLSSGSFGTASDRVFVRLNGSFKTIEDVKNVPLQANGRLLRLGDVATVTHGYQDPPTFLIRHKGQQVLVIGVTISKTANLVHLGKTLDAQIQHIQETLPLGIEMEEYADQSRVVKESVWEFERSFLEALAIVLAVSFLSLGWRTGIVVACSVPLVLALVAIVMYYKGWNLDRISLGALIIALGLLVDDAIIAVEMMVVKIEAGWDRVAAAGFAYTSTAFPMLTGTLITAAGFMPIGLAKSGTGQYAGGIFWITGIALIASWFVAILFTPYLGTVLLPKNISVGHHNPYQTNYYRLFRRMLSIAVIHKKMILLATLALFSIALYGFRFVQQQFFPTSTRPELVVDLTMKEGSDIAATTREVQKLEQRLAKDPRISHYTAYVGAGSPRFYLSLNPELSSPGYTQFIIMTKGSQEREALRHDLMALFDQDIAFPQLRARVARLELGPPVGYPVQFRVLGPDPDQVRAIAEQVRDTVRKSPLVSQTKLDWGEKVRTLSLQVNQDKARLLNVSSADISNLLQIFLSGAPATQIRKNEELIDVTVRAAPHERNDLARLLDSQVFTRSGLTVPLSQVAQVKNSFEDPLLRYRDRNLVITVASDVAEGVQALDATNKINPTLDPIRQALPPGYDIQIAGSAKESGDANASLFAVFPLMIFTMLFFLMLQLHSFSRVALVFLTAPLGLIGVIPTLILFQKPFGFVALLGVIALAGMVMRNSVILVDQIDTDIQDGTSPWEAILWATTRRTRPVLLTAAAAILAMIPLSRSVFWGPMAYAIMGGLLIATILTLIVVPALYATFFRVKFPHQQKEA